MLGALLTKKYLFLGYILTGGDTRVLDLNKKDSRFDQPSQSIMIERLHVEITQN